MLERPLGTVEGVVRAHRRRRLPVVLTLDEVGALLAAIEGVPGLVCTLLYGAGLRLLECLQLRVQDIDVGHGLIIVRDGKGQKDRVTMLPSAARPLLARQVAGVRCLHERDLVQGLGQAPLPHAIARKYPGADRAWLWQWVFPYFPWLSGQILSSNSRVASRVVLSQSVTSRLAASRSAASHSVPSLSVEFPSVVWRWVGALSA